MRDKLESLWRVISMNRLRDIPVGGKFRYINVEYVKLCETTPYKDNVKRLSNGSTRRLHALTYVEKL